MLSTQPPSAELASEVEALLERAWRTDGVAPVDEAGGYALRGETEAAHVLVRVGDQTLAYANMLPDGTVQGAVDPRHRRQGHASALLAQLQQHRARLDAPSPLSVWAHGELPPAVGFLRSRGLHPTRLLLELERDLDRSIERTRPRAEDIALTSVDPNRDAEDWLAVNREAFADHPEQGTMTRHDLDLRWSEPWFDPEDLHLARRGDELLGFVWMKQEPGAEDAEVYVVATVPAAQGTGIAAALLTRALERSRRHGARTASLFVEGDNAPALALYERLGFHERSRHVQFREV